MKYRVRVFTQTDEIIENSEKEAESTAERLSRTHDAICKVEKIKCYNN